MITRYKLLKPNGKPVKSVKRDDKVYPCKVVGVSFHTEGNLIKDRVMEVTMVIGDSDDPTSLRGIE